MYYQNLSAKLGDRAHAQRDSRAKRRGDKGLGAMTDSDSAAHGLRRRTPAALLGLLGVLVYGAVTVFTLFNGQTFAAEVSALVRSWWYASGALAPYSAADATREMPAYLYVLGGWQLLDGIGHLSGRLLSILLGLASGALLFAICRRLTDNTLAAAAAVFIFLATPATAFFFATATSAALAAALHLLAVLLILAGVGKPRTGVSVAMGLVCAALYFTRQDMLASVVVLAPLYIVAVGRDRVAQTVAMAAAIAAVCVALAAVFPAKFDTLALRLPAVGGLLGDAGLLGPDHILIARGTHAPEGLGAALSPARLAALFDGVLLPHAGTLLLAFALLAVAAGPLRALWAVPAYLLWLIATRYLGAAGACGICLPSATPTYIAVGALAAALTLAIAARRARDAGRAAGAVLVLGALAAVAINAAAPLLATQPAFRLFPRPMLAEPGTTPDLAEIRGLAGWISGQLPARTPVLVLHGLGGPDLPALPYAAVLAGHPVPPQSLDLAGTRRTINESLVGAARASVQTALERESLWSADTLRRWIARDFDAILLQDDGAPATAPLRAAIAAQFDRIGATRYRGRSIFLFTRKPAP